MSTNVNNLDRLQPGSSLDNRYVVKKLIEPGKFARVYLAEDLLYQKDCLVMLKHFLSQPG